MKIIGKTVSLAQSVDAKRSSDIRVVLLLSCNDRCSVQQINETETGHHEARRFNNSIEQS